MMSVEDRTDFRAERGDIVVATDYLRTPKRKSVKVEKGELFTVLKTYVGGDRIKVKSNIYNCVAFYCPIAILKNLTNGR